MIKAIIFDLGGVLFTNGTKQFASEISDKYNLEYDFVIDFMDGDSASDYREGKISRDEFWNIALQNLNINESIDTLEDEWIRGYKIIEGTLEIIKELKKKYQVYYLSDNVKERVDKINSLYNFISLFDGGVFSHEVGVRKPNPEIYKITLDKLGIKAEEAVFVDDKEKNLVPARDLGITCVLFDSPENLQEDLISLKILDKK